MFPPVRRSTRRAIDLLSIKAYFAGLCISKLLSWALVGKNQIISGILLQVLFFTHPFNLMCSLYKHQRYWKKSVSSNNHQWCTRKWLVLEWNRAEECPSVSKNGWKIAVIYIASGFVLLRVSHWNVEEKFLRISKSVCVGMNAAVAPKKEGFAGWLSFILRTSLPQKHQRQLRLTLPTTQRKVCIKKKRSN